MRSGSATLMIALLGDRKNIELSSLVANKHTGIRLERDTCLKTDFQKAFFFLFFRLPIHSHSCAGVKGNPYSNHTNRGSTTYYSTQLAFLLTLLEGSESFYPRPE
jgi:hypothetical protein